MKALAAALLVVLPCQAAFAACPMELAVYSDADDLAGIDFRPSGGLAMVSNSFRMALREDALLEGHVMWSDDPARPYGRIFHNCPEGDVTGEEIAACTLWQGVVYAVDENGAVGLMPGEGEPAPARLILADLGPQMRASPAFAAAGLLTPPSDVFSLSGCQE